MNFQLNLFVPGKRYRVLSGFTNWRWTFEAGEELLFINEAYSFYDSASLFEFSSIVTGETKHLVVDDEMVPAERRALLVEVD